MTSVRLKQHCGAAVIPWSYKQMANPLAVTGVTNQIAF